MQWFNNFTMKDDVVEELMLVMLKQVDELIHRMTEFPRTIVVHSCGTLSNVIMKHYVI